jgi:DNA-binding MarR family transcriptional regulator
VRSKKVVARQAVGGARYQPPRTISRSDYIEHGSDEWFREAIYTTVRALRSLLACRDAFGRELNLTASQFAVLMGIAYRQGKAGVNIRDLAQHIATAQTHVTTEVGHLIRNGCLHKRPDPKDGRGVLVSLSPKGRAAVERIAPLVREVNDLLFAGIDARAMKTASQVMGRIAENAEQVVAELRLRPRARRQ